jgi:protein-L-isoaspartate(D-aspartate) O-methyltransferase
LFKKVCIAGVGFSWKNSNLSKISVVKYLFAILSLHLFLFQGVVGQRSHPAFSERIDDRHYLVYRQLTDYPGIQIHDTAVLGALFRTPRHAFVPDHLQPYAYNNNPLPIGYNQTISQPAIVASMTQLLELEEDMKILEIGTGSGYQAAILAELKTKVFTIEIVPELGRKAQKTLQELGYNNVHLKIGDGYEGWPEHAPFDRIIVTCAPEEVPEPLTKQLKNGGKIVIPLGPQDQMQFLVVLKKNERGKLIRELKYPVRFVPMTGKAEDDQ